MTLKLIRFRASSNNIVTMSGCHRGQDTIFKTSYVPHHKYQRNLPQPPPVSTIIHNFRNQCYLDPQNSVTRESFVPHTSEKPTYTKDKFIGFSVLKNPREPVLGIAVCPKKENAQDYFSSSLYNNIVPDRNLKLHPSVTKEEYVLPKGFASKADLSIQASHLLGDSQLRKQPADPSVKSEYLNRFTVNGDSQRNNVSANSNFTSICNIVTGK